MLFISYQAFIDYVGGCNKLSEQEQLLLARQMAGGDEGAKAKLVECYLPYVASKLSRVNKNMQSLQLLYSFLCVLESLIDEFDFCNGVPCFKNALDRALRRAITNYIANS